MPEVTEYQIGTPAFGDQNKALEAQQQYGQQNVQQIESGQSAAAKQMQLGLGQARQQAQSQAAARGSNPLAQRAASYQQGQTGQQAVTQASMMQAQESANARAAQLANLQGVSGAKFGQQQLSLEQRMAQAQQHTQAQDLQIKEEGQDFGQALAGVGAAVSGISTIGGMAAGLSDRRAKTGYRHGGYMRSDERTKQDTLERGMSMGMEMGRQLMNAGSGGSGSRQTPYGMAELDREAEKRKAERQRYMDAQRQAMANGYLDGGVPGAVRGATNFATRDLPSGYSAGASRDMRPGDGGASLGARTYSLHSTGGDPLPRGRADEIPGPDARSEYESAKISGAPQAELDALAVRAAPTMSELERPVAMPPPNQAPRAEPTMRHYSYQERPLGPPINNTQYGSGIGDPMSYGRGVDVPGPEYRR